MSIETILSRLEKVHKTASGWTACCPAHEDKTPSLSITVSDNKILLHCHARCSLDAILEKIGIEKKDLFLDEPKPATRRQVAEYKYTDENNNYLFSCIRFEPKNFLQRTASGWGLNGSRRVLYRLPRLAEAIAEEERIFICEGEKDVDTLEALGLYATTNPMGAGKWREEYSDSLTFANCVIIPDNDEPGRVHAEQVAQSLTGKAKEVKILTLPGLADKGDVSDWLQNGGSKEKLISLADAAAFYKEQTTPEAAAIDFEPLVYIPTWLNCPPDTKPLVELSNVRILTRGNLGLLTALAGSGKTSIFEAACSSVLNPMGDTLGLTVNAKNLLYIDTERSKGDNNHSWQRFLRRSGIEHGGAAPATVRWENIKALEALKDRLSYLWSRIDAENAPELVFIDGIGDFVSDPNASDECTALVYHLGAVADIRNIAIMVSLHTNPLNPKARGVLGSELWRKCESVLIIEKTIGDDIRRLTTDFTLGKNRSGDDALSSYFRWDKEQKIHVSCNPPAAAKGKTICEREEIVKHLKTRPNSPFTELRAAIMGINGMSERTAESRIKDLVALGSHGGIIKNTDGLYSAAEENHTEAPGYIHE